jgi:16S rRNA (guanine966-N2)-methyltransferase
MRVIAGRFKGARLISPRGNWMRPTSDRVRESIFSVLGTGIENTEVLDLFAGTGSFGIEALSRGAAKATFVDVSARAVDLIEKNMAKVGVSAAVYHLSVQKFMQVAERKKLEFDIIYCDPPYRYTRFARLAEAIEHSGCLKADGMIIYESGIRAEIPLAAPFVLSVEKVAGDTRVSFFNRQ